MKAMQDKIIAVVTNLVLALALIVVAGTNGSDVTGNDEGEQVKLDEETEYVADVDASLIAGDDLYVGETLDSAVVNKDDAIGVIDSATEESFDYSKDVCNLDEQELTLKDIVRDEESDRFLVNVDGYLYVRAEADAEAEAVGKIFEGQGGKLIWQGKEWSYVRSGNVEGYIKNEYAWFGEEAEAQAEEKGELFAVIDTDKLRVRAQATTKSTTLGMVSYGDKLQIVEVGDEWTKVIFEQASAYVATDYVVYDRFIGTGMTLEEEQQAEEAEAARQAAIKEAEEQKRREEEAAMEKAIANSGVAEIIKTSAIDISAEDAYLIACCVSAEVGSSSYECQLAVANVILNRYKAGYASTVRGVIYAKSQFTVTTNGSMDRYIKNGPRATSVQAVKEALAGNNNMVGYYNFCYLPSAKFSSYSSYIIIGSEVFYRR